MSPYSIPYLYILVFAIGGIVMCGGAVVVAGLLAPRNPNPIKNTPYECGEEPTGSGWVQYNVRYYLFAMLFVLFDVEIVFLAPWAASFRALVKDPDVLPGALGPIIFFDMFVFLFFIVLGLVYAWRKKVLEWV